MPVRKKMVRRFLGSQITPDVARAYETYMATQGAWEKCYNQHRYDRECLPGCREHVEAGQILHEALGYTIADLIFPDQPEVEALGRELARAGLLGETD